MAWSEVRGRYLLFMILPHFFPSLSSAFICPLFDSCFSFVYFFFPFFLLLLLLLSVLRILAAFIALFCILLFQIHFYHKSMLMEHRLLDSYRVLSYRIGINARTVYQNIECKEERIESSWISEKTEKAMYEYIQRGEYET